MNLPNKQITNPKPQALNFWKLEKIRSLLRNGNWKLIGGFSLVELLVVIAIIGILASFAAASYSNAQQKGRDGKRKADIKGVQQALELYFQTNGRYPTSDTGWIQCNVNNPAGDAATTKTWGSIFSCQKTGDPLPIYYMSPLPKDPAFDSDANKRYYYSHLTDNSYVLFAYLENTNDQDYCSSNASCTSKHGYNCTLQAGRTYCQISP